MKKGAVAIFVKTPGISPIKTRLAADIGSADAEAFYRLSFSAVRDVIDGFCRMSHLQLEPFWAVAERDGLSSSTWGDFPTIWQGDGGLGLKLHHVYSQLMKSYDYVLLLGGDCPQISREPLLEAVDTLCQQDGYVMGKSYDGGFWIFGGNRDVPQSVWTKTPYSESSTAAVLEESLRQLASVKQLQKLQDVDYARDFSTLRRELISQQVIYHSQTELLRWLSAQGVPATSVGSTFVRKPAKLG